MSPCDFPFDSLRWLRSAKMGRDLGRAGFQYVLAQFLNCVEVGIGDGKDAGDFTLTVAPFGQNEPETQSEIYYEIKPTTSCRPRGSSCVVSGGKGWRSVPRQSRV
jgi:hypothetical protein